MKQLLAILLFGFVAVGQSAEGILPQLPLEDPKEKTLPPVSLKQEEKSPALPEVKKEIKVEDKTVEDPALKNKEEQLPELTQFSEGMLLQRPEILPPFTLLALARKSDFTSLWWKREELSIRFADVRFKNGKEVKWLMSPSGVPSAILEAKISSGVNPNDVVKKQPVQLTLKQAIFVMQVGENWIIETSAATVIYERGEDKRLLLPPSHGKAKWRSKVPSSGFAVSRWSLMVLDACREALTENISNEELRRLLQDSGEVVWVLAPKKN